MLTFATQRKAIGSLENAGCVHHMSLDIYNIVFSISQGRGSYWYLGDSKRIKNDIAGAEVVSS